MENITLRFNVEIDGETFAKVAKCLKVHEPEIFSKMIEEFKPQFDKILNEKTVERANRKICSHCGKYKMMQGNGILHQLCECGD